LIHFYGANGDRLRAYTYFGNGVFQVSKTNLYFAGRVILQNGQAAFVDRVESDRRNTRYYPYGEEYTATTNDKDKFATYFRDSSTGLDYAMNRYYGSNLGRFMSPDQGPPLLANPGSWNRYTYSWNDPINFNDPDGLLPAMVVLDGAIAPWISNEKNEGSGSGEFFLALWMSPKAGKAGKQPRIPLWAQMVDQYGISEKCARGMVTAQKTIGSIRAATGAKDILEGAATKYGLDWRLLAAIGVRESGFKDILQIGGGPGVGVFQITTSSGFTADDAHDLNKAAN
jgi:RHS repeat-associated protein